MPTPLVHPLRRSLQLATALAVLILLSVVSLGATASVASTPPAPEPLIGTSVITVGRGIGGVQLGDTATQVRRRLGPPTLVPRPGPLLPGQFRTIDWQYGAADALSVGFVPGKFIHGRVAEVAVMGDARYRTNKGIGIGSTIAEVRAAYPKATCKIHKVTPSPEQPNPNPITDCTVSTHYQGHRVSTSFIDFGTTPGVYLLFVRFAVMER